jgi:predicted Zn-dependent protease
MIKEIDSGHVKRNDCRRFVMGRKPVSVNVSAAGSRPKTSVAASPVTAEIRPRRSAKRGVLLKVVGVFLLLAMAAGLYFAYRQVRLIRLARSVRQGFAARHIDEAREPLKRWLALQPGSGEAHYYKAWAALAADLPGEAFEAIDHARKLGFDSALVDCLAAIGQSRGERFNEAEPILTRASNEQIEPRDLIARGLARIYLSSYRFDQATSAIERWRTLAPDDPEPYIWSNEILSRSPVGPALPIKNYRAALERDPNLDRARLGLAQQLSKAGRFDEAEQEFLAYLKRKPNDAIALLGLGRNAFQQGDIDNARRYFESALKANPREPDALKELSQIDIRLGRFQEACESMKRLTEIDPFDHEVRYTFAQALRLAGDNERAKAEFAHAARLRSENDQIVEFRNVVRKEPYNLSARFKVAKWMFDHGHHDAGLRWTTEIFRVDPRHSPTHKLLAEYYSKKGDAGLANYHRLMATADQEMGR